LQFFRDFRRSGQAPRFRQNASFGIATKSGLTDRKRAAAVGEVIANGAFPCVNF
jgi:hypothetical protein